MLTGVFCSKVVNSAVGSEGTVFGGGSTQLVTQLIAAGAAAGFAFVLTLVLAKVIDLALGFITDEQSEIEGLDRSEHGEVGFDMMPSLETAPVVGIEPRAATVPPNSKRYSVVVDGVTNGDLMHTWSDLCQPTTGAFHRNSRRSIPWSPPFRAIASAAAAAIPTWCAAVWKSCCGRG